MFCNYLQNDDFLIFFDESGINESCNKELYWSKKGERKIIYDFQNIYNAGLTLCNSL